MTDALVPKAPASELAREHFLTGEVATLLELALGVADDVGNSLLGAYIAQAQAHAEKRLIELECALAQLEDIPRRSRL